MADKFISEYTNQTTPASTSELLIDEGAGVYKALTLQNLFQSTATSNITSVGTLTGLTSSGAVVITNTTNSTSG